MSESRSYPLAVWEPISTVSQRPARIGCLRLVACGAKTDDFSPGNNLLLLVFVCLCVNDCLTVSDDVSCVALLVLLVLILCLGNTFRNTCQAISKLKVTRTRVCYLSTTPLLYQMIVNKQALTHINIINICHFLYKGMWIMLIRFRILRMLQLKGRMPTFRPLTVLLNQLLAPSHSIPRSRNNGRCH